jgi:hypothetical protein
MASLNSCDISTIRNSFKTEALYLIQEPGPECGSYMQQLPESEVDSHQKSCIHTPHIVTAEVLL